MREIKYRGKRVDNGEWHYGFYREFTMFHPWKHKAYRDGVNYYIDEKDTNECYLVIPETVGEFTGLKDKNGKEIYEGDIIKIYYEPKNFIAKVYWNKNLCSFQLEQYIDGKVDYDDFNNYYCNICEIVGNIYKNSDLLK